MKNTFKIRTREIMENIDKLKDTFEEYQDFLKKNLGQDENGEYLCLGQTRSSFGEPWIYTKIFCSNKELDLMLFMDYLVAYLKIWPMCEADLVNLIAVDVRNVAIGYWEFQDIFPLYERIIRSECED